MKNEKLVTIICLIVMFAIGFGTLVSDNKTPVLSENENRMLEGMPNLNIENVIDGSFAADFEKYMIDRIPLRNVIIGINDSISQKLSIVTMDDVLNTIDTQSVQQMENMNEEALEVITIAPITPTFTPQSTPSPEETDIKVVSTPQSSATPDPNKFDDSEIKSIKMTIEETDETNVLYPYNTNDVISYSYTLAQLSTLLPADGNLVHITCLESANARPIISNINDGNNITIIDETSEILEYYTNDNVHILSSAVLFQEPLEKHEQMYFFTDHHWSVEGAHYIYSKAMNDIGINPVKWEDYNIEYEFPFRGSYYKKAQTNYFIENPDTLAILSFEQADTFTHYLGGENIETLPILYSDAPENDRYRIYFDGPKAIGPMSTIETTSGTDRNVLIILDSYGLSFTTMLIPHYDTICLMDLRYMYTSTEQYYLSDMVEKYDVDDIFIVVGDLNAYGKFYHTLINQYMYSN